MPGPCLGLDCPWQHLLTFGCSTALLQRLSRACTRGECAEANLAHVAALHNQGVMPGTMHARCLVLQRACCLSSETCVRLLIGLDLRPPGRCALPRSRMCLCMQEALSAAQDAMHSIFHAGSVTARLRAAREGRQVAAQAARPRSAAEQGRHCLCTNIQCSNWVWQCDCHHCLIFEAVPWPSSH